MRVGTVAITFPSFFNRDNICLSFRFISKTNNVIEAMSKKHVLTKIKCTFTEPMFHVCIVLRDNHLACTKENERMHSIESVTRNNHSNDLKVYKIKGFIIRLICINASLNIFFVFRHYVHSSQLA